MPKEAKQQLQKCEDYFNMIPEMQASQEKLIFGLKDEIRSLDDEIQTL